MKKVILLLFALVHSIFWGQKILFQESFEKGNLGTPSITCNDGKNSFFTRTDGSDISSSYKVSGIHGEYFFAAQDLDGVKCGGKGNHTQTLTFNNINISGSKNLNFAILLAEDDASDKKEDWDDKDRFLIEYDIDKSGNFKKLLEVNIGEKGTNKVPKIDGEPLTSSFREVVKKIVGTGSSIDIKLTFTLNAKDEDIAIDKIRVIDGDIVAAPALSIISPANKTVFPPNTTKVTIKFSAQNFIVADGTGNGSVRYYLDDGSAIIQKNTNSIELSNVAVGNHTLKIELIDNKNNPLNPKVESTVDFSIATINDVDNLASLRKRKKGNYYKVIGEVIQTYDTKNKKHQRYIQDATAAILINDNDKKITTTYQNGDGITGLKGKLTSYKGILQFIPIDDGGIASSTGGNIIPEKVSLKDLNSKLSDYESKIITMENITFNDADGTKVFLKKTNYKITQDKENITFVTSFSNAPCIGKLIPSGENLKIEAIVGKHASKAQLYGIKIVENSLSIDKTKMKTNFNIYPNPIDNKCFTINTTSKTFKSIQIYNVLGEKILSLKTKKTIQPIDVSKLNPGIYILKIKENDKMTTKKIIIK